MHTIYCWNNLFYYSVQLKLSTFFPLPTHISLAVRLLRMLKKCTNSNTISHTSAAAFHSAFTSVIGWRTDMHKVLYVLHKVEWNSVGTDIVSTKHNVYEYFQMENHMILPALFVFPICLYQITPSSATNNPCNYHSIICIIFTY